MPAQTDQGITSLKPHSIRSTRQSVRQRYAQGRWDSELIDESRTLAKMSGHARDWASFLDICHSVRGLSTGELDQLEMQCNLPLQHHTMLGWRSLSYSAMKNDDRLHYPWDSAEQRWQATLLAQRLWSRTGKLAGRVKLGDLITHYPALLASADYPTTDVPEQTSGYAYNRAMQRTQDASKLTRQQATLSQRIQQLLKARQLDTASAHIAIVGNSPSLLETEGGKTIDDADIVIRFNRAQISKNLLPHTGKKTTIWVMSPATDPRLCPADIDAYVVSGITPLQRPSQYWPSLMNCHGAFTQFDPVGWYTLVEELGAPPSAGLLAVHEVSACDPALHISVHGFGNNSTAKSSARNHYADRALKSCRHNWSGEAQTLGQLVQEFGIEQ